MRCYEARSSREQCRTGHRDDTATNTREGPHLERRHDGRVALEHEGACAFEHHAHPVCAGLARREVAGRAGSSLRSSSRAGSTGTIARRPARCGSATAFARTFLPEPPAHGQALPLDGVPSHGRRHAGAMTAGTSGCRAGYAASEVPADRHSCRVRPHRRSSPERGCGVGSRTNDESRVYERSALWRALWTKPDYVED